MEALISHIAEEWFLTEPLLFSAYCTHRLVENGKMSVPMRTGKMRIEYNPEILRTWRKDAVEERLKYEVVRILLGHPYQRQPYKAKKSTLGVASDITLADSYHKISSIAIPPGLKYDRGLCFEEYYAIVDAFLKQNLYSTPYEMEGLVDDGGGGVSEDAESGASADSAREAQKQGSLYPDDAEKGNSMETEEDDDLLQQQVDEAAEATELWEEDQLAAEQVKETVRRAQRSRQWGSLAGNLKDEIEATTLVRIDYRTVLSGFRASVLCSKRRLTRMVPSRRYGFRYMGSKRDFATRLLVAIDVSGSVEDAQVAQALSIINRFFKYGVEQIDVIQFDCELRGEVQPMKKAQKKMKIQGRGGTNFQPPLDYFLEHRYDGLMMITDGYASRPEVPEHFYGNILWMLYNQSAFCNKAKQALDPSLDWIFKMPKSKYTILPPV